MHAIQPSRPLAAVDMHGGVTEARLFSPDRAMELAGRAASLVLVIALTANTLLVAVSPVNTLFAWIIVWSSAITALGLLVHMLWPSHQAGLLAALVAAGVWAANFIEITLSNGIRLSSVARQGGFYLAFFVASVSLYYVEKLFLSRNPEAE